MKTITYRPIHTTSSKKIFSSYVNSLNIPYIDYFAVGAQDLVSKTSISLMSSPEWQQHFIANQYANHDPVRQASLYTHRNFIPFVELDYVDNFGKEIMHQRARMGIKNGVILMQRFPTFNYIVTLGTDFYKFNAFDFIKRYYDKIWQVKTDLIQLIEKETKIFLSELTVKSF